MNIFQKCTYFPLLVQEGKMCRYFFLTTLSDISVTGNFEMIDQSDSNISKNDAVEVSLSHVQCSPFWVSGSQFFFSLFSPSLCSFIPFVTLVLILHRPRISNLDEQLDWLEQVRKDPLFIQNIPVENQLEKLHHLLLPLFYFDAQEKESALNSGFAATEDLKWRSTP